MANEIKTDLRLIASKGGMEVDRREQKTDITMTGENLAHFVQAVPTSNTALESVDIAGLGTEGLVFLKNLDSTNYISVGLTGSYTIRLNAGESCLFRSNQGGLYALANTATVNLEVLVIED